MVSSSFTSLKHCVTILITGLKNCAIFVRPYKYVRLQSLDGRGSFSKAIAALSCGGELRGSQRSVPGLEYEKAERQEGPRRVEGRRKRRFEGGEAFYAERVRVGAFFGRLSTFGYLARLCCT